MFTVTATITYLCIEITTILLSQILIPIATTMIDNKLPNVLLNTEDL